MKSIHLRSRIGRALLLVALLFGMGFMPNMATRAQDRDERDRQERRDRDRDRDRRDQRDDNYNQNRRGRRWDRYGDYGGSSQLRQTALNAGYNEGVKVGRRDYKRGRSSDYRNSSAYRNASTDYNSRLGDKELYRRYYRDGYENGYNDGYNGY